MLTNKKKISLGEIVANIPERDVTRIAKRIHIVNMIVKGMDEKGLGKLDLANYMGKSPSTITKWLSGDHNFESETLFDIEEALGINIISSSSAAQKEEVNAPLALIFSNPKYKTKRQDKFESKSKSLSVNFSN